MAENNPREGDNSGQNDGETSPIIVLATQEVNVQRGGISPSLADNSGDFVEPDTHFKSHAVPRKSPEEIPLKPQEEENSDDEAEDNCCPICFEPWCSVGPHRVCSLRCGHIFGRKCIERWLCPSRTNLQPKCPQCNAKVHRRDLVNLFVKKLTAVDNTELERLQRKLDEANSLRQAAEANFLSVNLKCQTLTMELSLVRRQCDELNAKIALLLREKKSLTEPEHIWNGYYSHERSFLVSGEGCCRVMLMYPNTTMLLISKPSPNQCLFPGHGVIKVDANNINRPYMANEFVRLHSQPVRDMCASPNENSLLLSCSNDKTLRITNLLSNSLVQSYPNPYQVWSCHWDTFNSNILYSGLGNGTLLVYDVRNTEQALHKLELFRSGTGGGAPQSTGVKTKNSTPIVSIKPMSVKDKNNVVRYGGVLVASLDGLFFINNNGPIPTSTFILNTQGPIISMSNHCYNEYCVVSQRPSRALLNTQHLVGDICEVSYETTDGDTKSDDFNSIAFRSCFQFNGGLTSTLMSRSAIFSPEPLSICVAAGDEETTSVIIWETASGSHSRIKSHHGVVIDVVPFWLNNSHYFATLSNLHCSIYKYNLKFL